MRLLFFEFEARNFAVILVTAVFLIAIFIGVGRGKAAAQSESALSQALELKKGLDNFFSDQDRFPTAEELTSENIALIYFSSVPDNASTNANCSQSFIYERSSLTSYSLNFCLAANLPNYAKGWNRFDEQK